MATAASLSIKLGLITATFDKDTKEARAQIIALEKAAKNLGDQFKGITGPIKQFGSAIAGIGIASAIHGAIQLADNVSDLAAGFNISTASVLKYREALQASGASTESAQQALTKLYGALDKARGGDEASINTFKQLGITWDQLKKIKPEQALETVSSALAKNGDAFEQVRLKRELFGKQNVGLDLDALSQKLKDNTGNWEEHAKRLERIKDISDSLKISSENLLIAVAGFIPKFADGAVSVEKFEAAIRAALTYFAVTRIVAIVGAVISLASAIRAMTTATVAFNLAAGSTTPIGILLKLAAAGIAVGAALYGDKLFKNATGGDTSETTSDNKGGGGGGGGSFSRREIEAAQARLDASRKLIDAEKKRLEFATQIVERSEMATKFSEIEFATAKKREELTAKIAELQRSPGSKDRPEVIALETKALKEQIAALSEVERLEKAVFTAREVNRVNTQTGAITRRGAFEAGRPAFDTPEARARGEIDFKASEEIRSKVGDGEGGYSEDQQKIIDAIKARADAEKDLLGIQEARVRQQQILTSTEQQAFSQLTSDLQALGQKNAAAFAAYKAFAIAQAIIDTYKSATSSYSALSGIPYIGPALGIAAAAAAIAAGLARVAAIRAQQPSGRAAGGPVQGGTPYMVGEQGREIVVPSQNGTVIPNHMTEKMMGAKGSQITIVNNPGSTFDERVLQTIMSNMKVVAAGIQNENVRTFAPNYYQMKGA